MQIFNKPTALDSVINGSFATVLKCLFALVALVFLNRFLSELAQNNFRFRSERHRYDWPREIAIVTGAASGFGRLIAKGLAEKGIQVMALDLHHSAPPDLQSNKKIHYYKCDVTSVEAVEKTADAIRAEHGNPSILINNAGIGFESSIIQTSAEKLRRIFEVNTLSHHLTVRAFLPSMIAQRKGHIVTMASMASFISVPYVHSMHPRKSPNAYPPSALLVLESSHRALKGIVHYCMTKSAALAFHEGLAAELRNDKFGFAAPEIKLTCVHPTWAETAMTEPFRQKLEAAGMKFIEPQTVADAVVNQVLSGRSKQIVLGGGIGWIAGIRAWPSWLSGGLAAIEGMIAR